MEFNVMISKLIYRSTLTIILAINLSGCGGGGGELFQGGALYNGSGFNSHPEVNGDLLGKYTTVSANGSDTLADIARRYDLGYKEVLDANPQVQTRGNIARGTRLLLPTAYILPKKKLRRGIVINIADLRLYNFLSDGTVQTFPVALGKEGWHTPIANTRIVKMKEAPSWHPPKSIRAFHKKKYGDELPRVVPPGPENPLGDYALYLGISGYLIHGTASPYSIGRLVSAGCIRMYNHDVERLFNSVKVGTPVRIIYSPVRAGYRNGNLYLEAQRPITHESAGYSMHADSPEAIVEAAAKKHGIQVNQGAVKRALRNRTGLPVKINS
jgi:L,D-transpeptidase ErfK/SrfK